MAQLNEERIEPRTETPCDSPTRREEEQVGPYPAVSARERRILRRVSPPTLCHAHIGHVETILVDLSQRGARVEHHGSRLQFGRALMIETSCESTNVTAECQVVASRVDRLIPGDDGSTVYQSRLLFTRVDARSARALSSIIDRLVARGLIEQVANASGIGPVLQRDMPTFRDGIVDAASRSADETAQDVVQLIRGALPSRRAGFIRCRNLGGHWECVWTLDPTQPEEGFTVSATERRMEIQRLCITWDRATDDVRRMIRACAHSSIESGTMASAMART